MTRIATRALVTGIALSLLSWAAPAEARTPFDGTIVTSDKRIPLSAKSKRAYFTKIRKAKKTKFREDKKKKQWTIHFAAFFKRPLNDLQVTIKIYDISGKKKQLLMTLDQYLDGRGQSNVISKVTLERERVGVNKRLLMVVERSRPYRGTLATGSFQILGEAERFSGKVDFTEEEANGKDSD